MYKSYFVIILTIGMLLFSISCSQKEDQLTQTQNDQIKSIGEESAIALMKILKEHLTEALNIGTTAEALEFCAAQAIPLTEQLQDSLKPGVLIKRTSSKYRNPDNAPDIHEEAALKYFEIAAEKGEPLADFYIQTLSDKSEYRYYKPMKMVGLCLKCHGEVDQIEPAVKQSLAENYPLDKAVGYKMDDFRGVIRVSIPVTLIKN